ncbi:MAG: glycosyltransferase [Candidatus Buchananbacteria bacterium]
MTICYFGIYDPGYSRNRILLAGLRLNNIKVIECRTAVKGPLKYWDLIGKHWSIRKKYDIMIVGFPGFQAMILARFLTSKPIIFDAFYSFFDSMVEDRKIVKARSFRGGYYWFLDWLSCRLADKILLDTNAHIDYFVKKLKLERSKFFRVLVGCDDKVIFPEPLRKKDYFLVHFHGSFIPLQGVEYIIEAAKILENENIKFNIIGRGQTYGEIIDLARRRQIHNVNFLEPVPLETLRDYLAQADLCLGVFGCTDKAKRVIPNKVYEGLAARRPVLTGDSPAVRELLTDGRTAVFCRLADAQDLAAKILELREGRIDYETIAANGYEVYQRLCRPEILVKQLLDSRLFEGLLNRKK